MNINSRENCGLNVKPLALLPLLLLKLLSAIWASIVCMHSYFDHLFVRLPSLCLSIRLLCTHFSFVHSFVIVCAWGILVLLKLLLEFRNVLKHTESEASLLVIKI